VAGQGEGLGVFGAMAIGVAFACFYFGVGTLGYGGYLWATAHAGPPWAVLATGFLSLTASGSGVMLANYAAEHDTF